MGPMGYKDIYTPSNDRGSSRPAARTVFLTEAEGKQSEN